MANMRTVNQYIKSNFPELDIQAVSGKGYVYFNGDDGFGKISSLYVDPRSVDTEELVQLVLEQIQNDIV